MNFYFAADSDLDLLAEWNHQLIRDEDHRNPMSVAELRERMRGWLAGEYRAVIFYAGEAPAAYALYRESQGEVYLRQFFVRRDCRRQGLGRAALAALMGQVWPAGKRLTVEVLTANQRGVAFWRSVGYRDYSLTLEVMPVEAVNLYERCPVYAGERFTLRLVAPEDAPDLLACYADPLAAPLFNSDNCTSDFVYTTPDAMAACIRFWLEEYARGYYVRFSIVDRAADKAVGTVECFAKSEAFPGFGKVGVLRLDLASPYEREDVLSELLALVERRLFDGFGVDSMITKAIPAAQARIRALEDAGYRALAANTIVPFSDYYARTRS